MEAISDRGNDAVRAMIRYALKCGRGHAFESWFQSAEAFERLATAGRLACPECGDSAVTKALMAPPVRPARKAATERASEPARPLAPATEIERKLASLRAHVEANSDYVGMNFAAEARAIHAGEAPERSIWGETRPADAKALIEDGVPVAPLPFVPTRKAN